MPPSAPPQVVKLEPYDSSPLVRFLLTRALRSPLLGHALFWHLKAELPPSQGSLTTKMQRRFARMAAEYIQLCGAEMRRHLGLQVRPIIMALQESTGSL